jgi:hypothetical protein
LAAVPKEGGATTPAPVSAGLRFAVGVVDDKELKANQKYAANEKGEFVAV